MKFLVAIGSFIFSCGGPLVPFDIDKIAIPREGLVSEWLFEGNYTDSMDINSVANYLDGNNAFVTDRFGKVSSLSLNVNGVGIRGLQTTSPKVSFYYTESFTISIWANTPLSTFSSNAELIDFTWGGGLPFGVSLTYNGGSSKVATSIGVIGVSSDIGLGNNITHNQWEHYVLVYNNTITQLYMNGNLVNTTIFNPLAYPTGFPTTPAGGGIRFGVKPGSQDFIGKLDDVRIYKRALNSEEIMKLYHEKGFGY